MKSLSSEEVLAQVDGALASGRAIIYSKDIADVEHPNILWTIFGLIETNEIAVVGQCGATRVGISAPSPLLHPPMADRLFGIDLSDGTLARQLSKEIWEREGQVLVVASCAMRPPRG